MGEILNPYEAFNLLKKKQWAHTYEQVVKDGMWQSLGSFNKR